MRVEERREERRVLATRTGQKAEQQGERRRGAMEGVRVRGNRGRRKGGRVRGRSQVMVKVSNNDRQTGGMKG